MKSNKPGKSEAMKSAPPQKPKEIELKAEIPEIKEVQAKVEEPKL